MVWIQACIKPYCEACGSNYYLCVHHFFRKSSYPQLKYEKDNGTTLCRKCHFNHHFNNDPKPHAAIILKRGKKWYNKLLELSRKPIKPSFKTEEYLRKVISHLL